MSRRLLDELVDLVDDALTYNSNAEAPPRVLLWPDADDELGPLVQRLRERRPVLTLGEYAPDEHAGPAYWLRCVLAKTIELDLPDGVPVLYLPGVGRDDLRAIEDCPDHLAPIAELQYRGNWFSHPNGRDWTAAALLSNTSKGLGLTVAEDATTRQGIVDTLPQLLDLPVHQLRQDVLNAPFLQDLLAPDVVGSLLSWLDDPPGHRSRVDDATWTAFSSQVDTRYGLDPSTDGELSAAERMGTRDGMWQEVWDRYAAEPERYPGVAERLRLARPGALFTEHDDAWPQVNEEAESKLQTALLSLGDEPAPAVRERITELEAEHGPRRTWVWAALEQAPLAFALEQLTQLASATSAMPGGDLTSLVGSYADSGWKADDAFLAALASVEGADRDAVGAAATALYRPWLEVGAKALQAAATSGDGYAAGAQAPTEPGTVVLFVDGLRLDVAHRLADAIGGDHVTVGTALAALPTVTATSKPALVPIDQSQLASGSDLAPTRAGSSTDAGIQVLRKMMDAAGVQVIQGADTGDVTGVAWTEAGEIDSRGHQFGAGLVDDLDAEVGKLAKRIRVLLDAGWTRVDVVTDHGWLLLPGGLPKIELPVAVVEKKKGRCARLKPGADVDVPAVPWHWDADVAMAVAPGIGCFEANREYEHGGVSLQECVVPRVTVTAPTSATTTVTSTAAITKVKWLGLRLRFEYEQVPPGAVADLRARPGEPVSSVAMDPKETVATGKGSLIVPDEDLEGETAHLVLVASDGSIIAQREVTIGENR